MSADDILRLNYSENQFLGVTDFDDEQAYLIESRRRIRIADRTWGILSGLVIQPSTSGPYVVTAGAALDAYGREIYVFEDTPLDVLEIGSKLANHATPATLKIWISYAIEDTSPAAAGYLTCADAALNTRTRESFRLIYQDDPVPFDAQLVDDTTRWPVAVQDLPDDPKEAAWPLLLGTIEWNGAAITKVVDAGRRYSGLHGAEVLSQTSQLDIHPANVRLLADKLAGAVITTKKGTPADSDATTALHLGTNEAVGGAGVFVDKDDVTLGQKLTVTGTATLKDTVGNGSGKLVLEVDPANNIATLTRRNGSGSDHDIAIRTNDGAGGNRVLIDSDILVIQNLTVEHGAVLKEGRDTWRQIVFRNQDGTDDGDTMAISRAQPNNITERNDLRVQIGDELDTHDRFVVGPVSKIDQQFKEQFIVDNLGNVTAKGNADIAGSAHVGGAATIGGTANITGLLTTTTLLITTGLVNGRNIATDRATLDALDTKVATISPNVNVVAIQGHVSNGGTIPLPSGFSDPSECVWIVRSNPLSITFHTGGESRVVNVPGGVDYVTFGVR
ncbi:MAG: hypothetical protein QOE82_1524 [Thermoanaerobaculia bacterium]|nr:hypothetical protein [Thermoanaerobaculia bacterium]